MLPTLNRLNYHTGAILNSIEYGLSAYKKNTFKRTYISDLLFPVLVPTKQINGLSGFLLVVGKLINLKCFACFRVNTGCSAVMKLFREMYFHWLITISSQLA